MLLFNKDTEFAKTKLDMEADIRKRVQSVAQYYQQKEQKLLKHIHDTVGPILTQEPHMHQLNNSIGLNSDFQSQINNFLLAVEIERIRSLYNEKEEECHEIMVSLIEYY